MKQCPKCGNKHQKQGQFCSKSCSNSRTWTDEDKRKKAESLKKFYQTENGQRKRQEQSKLMLCHEKDEQTRNKISNTLKKQVTPEFRQKMSERAANKVFSQEAKQKLSEHAKRRQLGGHNSKKKMYFEKNNGEVVHLQSSYEIQFASILEKLEVDWERPDPLVWIDEHGIDHKYYPDFKVNEIYLDTKNDYLARVDQDKIQKVKEQNNVDLRIVTNDQINEQYIGSLV